VKNDKLREDLRDKRRERAHGRTGTGRDVSDATKAAPANQAKETDSTGGGKQERGGPGSNTYPDLGYRVKKNKEGKPQGKGKKSKKENERISLTKGREKDAVRREMLRSHGSAKHSEGRRPRIVG